MGPEYLSIIVSATIASATGAGWVTSRILMRLNEKNDAIRKQLGRVEMRTHTLEEEMKRLPVDYVLKADFLREIQNMHDNFKEINTKLDRMIEKLLR